MIDRYKCVVSDVQATAHAAAHPDGEYVRWGDYSALAAENEELKSRFGAAKRISDLEAELAEARGALMELRTRLHAAGRRPEECYEMSLIDDTLRATDNGDPAPCDHREVTGWDGRCHKCGYTWGTPESGTVNQCDGCRQGLPVNKHGNHVKEGLPWIGCTAARYTESEGVSRG